MTFNNEQKKFFLRNWNVIKVNLPTHICLTGNYLFFFVISHWSSFKGNDILHTLNVYKIPAKKHQVVDSCAADEISVSEILFGKYLEYVLLILHNYKKAKRTKVVRFIISCILSAQ